MVIRSGITIPAYPGIARGQRHSLVETQEAGLARPVLDEHCDVVHARAELRRDAVERLGHELFEPLRRDEHARTLPTGRPEVASAAAAALADALSTM